MRRNQKTAKAARMDRGETSIYQHASSMPRWRVWMPEGEQNEEEGNACQGIALALGLSLPIWLVLGALAIMVAA